MEETVSEMSVAGELLNAVEWSGAMTLRQLIRKLDSPLHLVVMAVGVLVRQGLIQVTERDHEVLVEPMPEWSRVPQTELV